MGQEKMIYFIQANDGGPIKVGYAVDPQKRLTEIQRMSPVPLRILATINGYRKDEALLHRRFASLRLHGEWFRPSQELLDIITRKKLPFKESYPPGFERSQCLGVNVCDGQPCKFPARPGSQFCGRHKHQAVKGIAPKKTQCHFVGDRYHCSRWAIEGTRFCSRHTKALICQGVNGEGKPCKHLHLKGSLFCFAHQDQLKDLEIDIPNGVHPADLSPIGDK